MCSCCRKKKKQKPKQQPAKIAPPKKLSALYHPPKPPSQWLLWQTYFTLQSFHDDIYRTRTLNRVIAPFAFSTHLAALQRTSSGITLKFFTSLLHFDGFYATKTFEHDLLQILQDFPLNNVNESDSSQQRITTTSKFIFCNDLKPSGKWKKYVMESMKLQVIVSKTSEIAEMYKLIQGILNEAIGTEFMVSDETKLCQKETKLLSVVGTRIKAGFANTETYHFKKASFMLGYGMKEKNHPFFIAKGEFANVVFNDFEAWKIPLKQSDRVSINGDNGYEPKMSLILVRPTLIGNILDTKSSETFDEIAKAINILIQRKKKKATLLLPEVDLPFSHHTTFGITDLITNWKQGFDEEITSNLGKLADGVFASCALDRFFHCASIRVSDSGVSYQGDTDSKAKPRIFPLDNNQSCKPAKIKKKEKKNDNKNDADGDDEMRRSEKLQRLIKAEMAIPQGLLKPRREKLYHFHARFDSPFLFFIVDEKWASILMAGCYAGKPALTSETLRKPATEKQINSRKKKTKESESRALVKAKKQKKKCCIC